MNDVEMIRGLVRAAELLEQRDGGEIWDSEVNAALKFAREQRNWGKNKIGEIQFVDPWDDKLTYRFYPVGK
jgi:hypothetical protein